MKITCMCCGFVKEFTDGEQAFEEGWDAPPHFTGYTCCNLCPGSFVVLGITDKHKTDHERWVREGRPEHFQIPNVDL